MPENKKLDLKDEYGERFIVEIKSCNHDEDGFTYFEGIHENGELFNFRVKSDDVLHVVT